MLVKPADADSSVAPNLAARVAIRRDFWEFNPETLESRVHLTASHDAPRRLEGIGAILPLLFITALRDDGYLKDAILLFKQSGVSFEKVKQALNIARLKTASNIDSFDNPLSMYTIAFLEEHNLRSSEEKADLLRLLSGAVEKASPEGIQRLFEQNAARVKQVMEFGFRADLITAGNALKQHTNNALSLPASDFAALMRNIMIPLQVRHALEQQLIHAEISRFTRLILTLSSKNSEGAMTYGEYLKLKADYEHAAKIGSRFVIVQGKKMTLAEAKVLIKYLDSVTKDINVLHEHVRGSRENAWGRGWHRDPGGHSRARKYGRAK